jgi:hypothetical protein
MHTDTSSSAFDCDACLPLLIGVTGHRDLRADDEPIIADRLRVIFTELRERYRSTPLLLLSSLADGADRLTARVALELGVGLCVVLPMPVEYYRLDFTDAASVEEFERLSQRAIGSVLAPMSEELRLDDLADPRMRELQYIQASLYVARYSHIMLALWDGADSPSPGGTRFAVHARLNGGSDFEASASDPLDAAEVGVLYHVITPRRSSPVVPDNAGTCTIEYPQSGPSPEHYERLFTLLDEYNRDILEWHATSDPSQCATRSILPHSEIESPPLEQFCRRFTAADRLAGLYQHRTRRAFIGLFAIVFVAATAFDVYGHLHHWTGKIGLVGYVLLFAVAWVWYRTAYRRRYQAKYLDYRAVAEGMRVQLYWHLAGIEQMVGEHYLRKQKSELDWIRYALNAATIELQSHTTTEHLPGSMMERLDYSYRQWVESQRGYFARIRIREQRRLERLERLINRSFVAAFVLAVVQLTVADTYVIIIPMGLLPVVAGLLVGYIEKIGLHGHIKASTYMADLFHRAERRIADALAKGSHHTAKHLLFELGKEALGENGDWLLYHRERPLEVPKG